MLSQALLATTLAGLLCSFSGPAQAPRGAAEPIPDVELLRLAPNDALFALRIKDPRALLSRRETSRWAAFLADPAWHRVVADLRDADPRDDAATEVRAESVAADLLGALGSARSAVAIAVGDLQGRALPILAFAALGGDELAAPLEALLRGQGTVSDEDGLAIRAADGGVVEAYLRRGDLHLIVNAPDSTSAVAFGRAALARLDSGAALGGRLAEFRSDADAEFTLDLRPLWRLAAEAADLPDAALPYWSALDSTDWLHGQVRIGDGEALDLVLEAPYAEEGLARSLLGAFGPCDTTLLALAPVMAVSASAGRTDFGALFDSLVAEIQAQSPRQHELVVAGLKAASEAFDIDVRGDLVAGLTGDYVSFSLPPDMRVASRAMTLDERMNALDMSCTALRIADPEPFIDAIETLLDVSGLGAEVEATTLRGAEVWTFGNELHLAVHPRFLCGSLDLDALEVFLSRVNADEDAPASLLSQAPFSAAARGLQGTYVSLAPTKSSLSFVGNLLQLIGLSLRDSDGAGAALGTQSTEARLARTLTEVGDLVSVLGPRYFSGTFSGRVTVQDGRIRSLNQAR
ncbi:MAG: hypothetical protein R3F49_09820 [Planctomycetota bacterium]